MMSARCRHPVVAREKGHVSVTGHLTMWPMPGGQQLSKAREAQVRVQALYRSQRRQPNHGGHTHPRWTAGSGHTSEGATGAKGRFYHGCAPRPTGCFPVPAMDPTTPNVNAKGTCICVHGLYTTVHVTTTPSPPSSTCTPSSTTHSPSDSDKQASPTSTATVTHAIHVQGSNVVKVQTAGHPLHHNRVRPAGIVHCSIGQGDDANPGDGGLVPDPHSVHGPRVVRKGQGHARKGGGGCGHNTSAWGGHRRRCGVRGTEQTDLRRGLKPHTFKRTKRRRTGGGGGPAKRTCA
jgi:hypothetical protein